MADKISVVIVDGIIESVYSSNEGTEVVPFYLDSAPDTKDAKAENESEIMRGETRKKLKTPHLVY